MLLSVSESLALVSAEYRARAVLARVSLRCPPRGGPARSTVARRFARRMLSDSLTVAHSLVSAARGEHSARCQASTPLQPHVDLLLRAIVSALDGSCTEAKEAWRGLSGAPPQSDPP